MTPEDKFHEHHQRLIDEFKSLRDEALESPLEEGESLVEFLRDNITPHAEAEESVLYGEIDRIAGNQMATSTMRAEHNTLGNIIDQLENLLSKPESFREELTRFSHLLLNHFNKEESTLIPFLSDELSEGEMTELLEEVHENEHSHA